MSSSLKFKSVVILVFLFGSVVYGDPWPGSGDANDPYQIHNAQQMQAIGADANYWGAHFKLMKDIDLGDYTGESFNIIGNDVNAFTGVFDGDGHTISNFTYEINDIYEEIFYIGVFGYIEDPNAEIKNLGLIEPDVNAEEGWYVGSLAGYLTDGTVTNCYVEGGNILGGYSVGGLVGDNWSGSILDCYSTGSVSGGGCTGGLAGHNRYEGIISNCYSTGDVTGVHYTGGLVGHTVYGGISEYGSSISDSYSTGDVTGDYWVGGLVGYNTYYNSISNSYSEGTVTGIDHVGGLTGENMESDIENCYSQSDVIGEDFVGGLVGRNESSENSISDSYSTGSVAGGGDHVGGLVGLNAEERLTRDSYWDVESSGLDTSDGGVGLTTAEMQSKAAYMFWSCDEQTWTIDDGNDYPRLLWEGKPGEVIEGLGCGTEEEPYLVYGAGSMQVIGASKHNWDKRYKLMADIDMSEYTGTMYNIIGNYDDPFEGVFDGNGHTISNFTYDSNGVGGIGLFGYIQGAEVKNLGLIDPNVSAGTGNSVGCLIGVLDGSVSDCYVEGGSVTGEWNVGGLVGGGWNISNCYSTSVVTGFNWVGGLVGSGWNISNSYSLSSVTGNISVGGLAGRCSGNISNSYSEGIVTGMGGVGGLVGEKDGGNIMDCYSRGSVTGDIDVGGLTGYGSGNISNSYSSSSVTGNEDVGGLVGEDWSSGGDYTASFWDSDVNPDVNGIGNATEPNVVGLPTVLMQTESTFTDAGWDFVGEVINGPNDIWKMNCEGMSYPKLSWWEAALGDFICPDGVDMIDFAVLGEAWMSEVGDLNWDAGCDISEPNDNVIDGQDLAVFVGNWLCN
jgi:hypothetical protein